MRFHYVRRGEHLAGIAHHYGLDSDSIWDLEENAALRDDRGDGSILAPGDLITIPDPPPRRILRLEPGATLRVEAHVERVEVSLRLVVEGEPVRSRTYRVTAPGLDASGRTDAEGALTFEVSPTVRRAIVEVASMSLRFPIEIGGLDPNTTRSGASGRLAGLGHLRHGSASDEELQHAVRTFQERAGLEPTGALTEETVSQLAMQFGR